MSFFILLIASWTFKTKMNIWELLNTHNQLVKHQPNCSKGIEIAQESTKKAPKLIVPKIWQEWERIFG